MFQVNLTAQDGMDVSLQNFEKVTIDGNVAATILGTAAADTLVGDAGAGTITGKAGADTLTGGSKSDKFVFTTGDTGITEATADTITDFSTGTDKIDIATVGSYVEADGSGNADLAAFITDADASLTTNLLIYMHVTEISPTFAPQRIKTPLLPVDLAIRRYN